VYSQTTRAIEYIAELSEFISRTYGIAANSIVPANRGYYGETWKIETKNALYFAKLDYWYPHNKFYQRSFPVMEKLYRYGIVNINKIIKTIDNKLYSRFKNAVFGLFDWIDGVNVQDKKTMMEEFKILAKVYTVPAEDLELPTQDFSLSVLDILFKHIKSIKDKDIVAIFDDNSLMLNHCRERLSLFAGRCDKLTLPHFITHGDAGGNIIIGGNGTFYLVDWDNPVLAPPERDAWFYMRRDWAIRAFQNSLNKNAVNYTLNQNVMAFYCYYYWFHYLNNYMERYFDERIPNSKITADITAYLAPGCWINNIILYADKLS
jgi:hypothetical protein